MRYKVTWTDIYSKNLNGRKYSPNCFENAINKLGDNILPVFLNPDDVDPIGYALNFNIDNKKETLSAEIQIWDNFPPITEKEFCLAGSGDTTWLEDAGRGWLEVNPHTYRFISTYLSKKSAFPVSMRMEINTNE